MHAIFHKDESLKRSPCGKAGLPEIQFELLRDSRSSLKLDKQWDHFRDDAAGVSVWVTGEIWFTRDRPAKERSSLLKKLLEIYMKNGRIDQTLALLDGHFILLLEDTSKKHFVVAVDPLGLNKVYYSRIEGSAIITDNIFQHCRLMKTASPNLQGIADYLTFYTTIGSETLIEGIKSLEPAEFIVISKKAQTEEFTFKSGKYIIGEGMPTDRVNDNRKATDEKQTDGFMYPLSNKKKEELSDELKFALNDSLKDVACSNGAVSFSGGLDSSAVLCELIRLGAPIAAVQAGFGRTGDFSEYECGKSACRRFGIQHEYYDLYDMDPTRYVDRVMDATGEPSLGTGGIVVYALAERLGSNRVIYSGQGSDELLGGYARYSWATFWSRTRQLLLSKFLAFLGGKTNARYEKAGLSQVASSVHRRFFIDNFWRIFDSPEERYLYHISPLGDSIGAKILLEKSILKEFLGVSRRKFLSRLAGHGGVFSGGDPLDAILAFEKGGFLRAIVGTDLRIRKSLGIRSVFPFATKRFSEFAASVPSSLKINGFTSKYLLREAYRDELGEDIVGRRKCGFPVPFRDWLAGSLGEMVRDTINSNFSKSMRPFDSKVILQLLGGENKDHRYWDRLIWLPFALTKFFERVKESGRERDCSRRG
jgi:asparagine synthase (glutamine-hydrolysing)